MKTKLIDAPAIFYAPLLGVAENARHDAEITHEHKTKVRFIFSGQTWEYFKIWSVNVMLTIITLGIFSAWAKVRTRRYFYGNTFLSGANFDYHAKPLSILLSRIVVVAIILFSGWWAGEHILRNAIHSTMLAVFIPWALTRALSFNARYTSYRNIRFSFKREYLKLYLIMSPLIAYIVIPSYIAYFYALANGVTYRDESDELLILISVWFIPFFLLALVMLPLVNRAYHRFKVQNHSLGKMPFKFNAPPISRYTLAVSSGAGFFVLSLLLWIIFATMVTVIDYATGGVAVVLTLIIFLCFLFLSLAGTFLVFIMPASMMFCLFWNNINVDGGEFRCSVSAWDFAVRIKLVNALAILFSLGALSPWAKIRQARFLADNIYIMATPELIDDISGRRDKHESALGEELNVIEGFDFDIGLV